MIRRWASSRILQVDFRFILCMCHLPDSLPAPAYLPPPLLILSRRLSYPPLLISRPPSGHSLALILSLAPLVSSSPQLSSPSTSSSSSTNHILLLCQSSVHIVVRGASLGRILAGAAPGRIAVHGAAPRRIVVIGATPGRTIVRGAAPSRILARLSRSSRLRARLYRCKRRGSQPCSRRCRARPNHCTRRGTMVRGTTPRLLIMANLYP